MATVRNYQFDRFKTNTDRTQATISTNSFYPEDKFLRNTAGDDADYLDTGYTYSGSGALTILVTMHMVSASTSSNKYGLGQYADSAHFTTMALIDSTTNFEFGFGDTAITTDAGTMTTGNDYRLALVYNGSGTVSYYVNGFKLGSFTTTVSSGFSSIVLGHASGETNAPHTVNGYYSNFQIWEYAFSEYDVYYDYRTPTKSLYWTGSALASDNSNLTISNCKIYLPLNETSGTTAHEYVSNTDKSLTGSNWSWEAVNTVYGGLYTAYSLEFDGTDDNIDLGFHVTNDNDYTAIVVAVFDKNDDCPAIGQYDSSQNTRFILGANSGDFFYAVGDKYDYVNQDVSLNTEYLLALKMDVSASSLILSKNGSDIDSNSYSSFTTPTDTIHLGTLVNASGWDYDGTIRDVAFIKALVSETDMTYIYQHPEVILDMVLTQTNNSNITSFSYTDIEHYYTLQEGQGNTVYDLVTGDAKSMSNFPTDDSQWSRGTALNTGIQRCLYKKDSNGKFTGKADSQTVRFE